MEIQESKKIITALIDAISNLSEILNAIPSDNQQSSEPENSALSTPSALTQ